MPWTTPETFTAGQTLTAASMNKVSGNLTELANIGSSAAWTSFTPSWVAGISSIGNATQAAAYLKVGRLVAVRFGVTMGSTTTFSGTFSMTLPVAASSTAYQASSNHALGWAMVLDAGTSYYPALVRWSSSTSMVVEALNAAGTYLALSSVTATVPMTWTTNDQINGTFVYEAAA